MFTSPEVYPGTLQLPYPSREQWRQRLSDTAGGSHYCEGRRRAMT